MKAAVAFQTPEQAAMSAGGPPPYKPLQLLSTSVLREYILHMLRPDAFARRDATTRPKPLVTYMMGGKVASGAASGSALEGGADAAGPLQSSVALGGAGAPEWWEPERLVDDFVLLTFLVGNDFLPHLPTLPISAGGLDVMIDTYRKVCRLQPM